MGLFADISPFSSSSTPSNDVKVAVRNFTPAGTGKIFSTRLNQFIAQPIEGQPNNTPTDDPNSDFFAIDTYRNGAPGGTDPEQINGRTLSDEDENIASLTLVGNDQTTIVDSYSRFFLQAISEVEQEKYQVVETFTGFYAFFYGKRPPIYRYSGLLLADKNYRWNNDFKFVYENYFRGTRAVEFNAEVTLTYPGRIIVGFPLSLSMQQDAIVDKGIPFSIDILVVDHQLVNFSIDLADLIEQAADELAQTKAQIQAAQMALQQSSGTTILTSDLSTNGILPPNSVNLPNISPTSYGAVSQLIG